MTVDYSDWAECNCEFDEYDPGDRDSAPSYHFLRACKHCGGQWSGLHCPHDGHQTPCAACGVRPDPEI